MKTSKEKKKIKIDPMIIAMIIVVICILVIVYYAFKYSFRDIMDKINEDTRQKIELVAQTVDDPSYMVVSDGEDKYLVVFAEPVENGKNAVRIKSARRIDGILSVNVKFEQSQKENEKGFALVKLNKDIEDVYVYYEEGELGSNDETSTLREIEIDEFKGGVIIDKDDRTLVYKFGYLDENGKLIIPQEYVSLVEKKDFLVASKNESNRRVFGILDKKGNTKFDFIYDEITVLPNGNLQVIKMEDEKYKTAVYSIDGTLVNDWMDGYVSSFNYGYAVISASEMSIENEGNVGLVNENFEIVVPRKYDEMKLRDVYYQVKLGEKVGLISNANEIIVPIEYDVNTNFKVECDYKIRKANIYIENEEKNLVKQIDI